MGTLSIASNSLAIGSMLKPAFGGFFYWERQMAGGSLARDTSRVRWSSCSSRS